MRYLEVLQAVDPSKTLKGLGIEPKPQGAYIHFACQCGKTAAIKAYGVKKNLWYCNHCKAKGHIIGLAMQLKNLEWEEAKVFLKSYAVSQRKSLLPLNFRYELAYSDILEKKGLTKEACERLGIGKPKGKTMLAGCIAFEVKDQDKLVAYFGLRIKDGSSVYHNSFNPELYLYNYDGVDAREEVYFTTDMWRCIDLISREIPCVCNFGLPYLSESQFALLQNCHQVTYHRDSNFHEIMKQVQRMRNTVKFIE
jgi:hypothetical protein